MAVLRLSSAQARPLCWREPRRALHTTPAPPMASLTPLALLPMTPNIGPAAYEDGRWPVAACCCASALLVSRVGDVVDSSTRNYYGCSV
eukprot:2781924-Rhodomonas_salina.2